MRPLILIIIITSIAACSPRPVAQVDIPVAIPCLGDVPESPIYRIFSLPLDSPDAQKILTITDDFITALDYEEKLRAAIIGCQGLTQLKK